MEEKTARKSLLNLLTALSAIGLALFAALAFYNQPTIDDFWYTWMMKKWGFAEAQHQWYITINARYSSNALMSLNSFVWGSVLFFKVFPILLLFGYWGLFSLLAKKVIYPDLSNTECQKIGLLFTAVYTYGMPGFYEGFYWCSALAGYQVPFILWGFALFFLFSRRKKGTYFLQMAGWGIFILILSGFHELMALQITLVMAFLASHKNEEMEQIRPLLHVALAVSALSLVFHLISAGNLHKAQITADKNSTYDYYLLVLPLIQFGYHLLRGSLLNPLFFVLLIFFAIQAKKGLVLAPFFGGISKRKGMIIACLLVALATGPVFLVSQIEGSKTPLRVINFSYGMLFIGFLIFATVWFAGERFLWTGPVNRFFLNHAKWFLSATTLVFVAGILLKGQPIISPLVNGSARLYNQQVNQRFNHLATCRSMVCVIDCLDAQPLVLCPVDACNDPTMVDYLEKVYGKRIQITDSASVQVPLR